MITCAAPTITRIGKFKELHYGADKENLGALFHILRNQLYSDKLGAVIREYATNAADIHNEIDQTRPFEVRLPTSLNPTLRIRDFGTGLSLEEIGRIYLMMGKSTKQDSPLLNGCLGIGCKSGFAYTDAFDVISRNENQYIAGTAYVDESREGRFAITEERNLEPGEEHGMEIVIPIRNEDFEDCRNKCIEILEAFQNPPLLLEEGEPIKIKSRVLGTPVRLANKDSGSEILCANVCYPLNLEMAGISLPKDTHIVLEMPPKSFAHSASRESIEYVRETKLAIKAHLDAWLNGLKKYSEEKLNPLPNPWVANLVAWKHNQTNLDWYPYVHFDTLYWRGEKLAPLNQSNNFAILEGVFNGTIWNWRRKPKTYRHHPERTLIVFPAGKGKTITVGQTRKQIDELRCPWAQPMFERAEKENFKRIWVVLHNKEWNPSECAETGIFPELGPKSHTMVLNLPPKREQTSSSNTSARTFQKKKLSNEEIQKQIRAAALQRIILQESTESYSFEWGVPGEEKEYFPRRLRNMATRGKPLLWWKNIRLPNTPEPPRILICPPSGFHHHHENALHWSAKLFGPNTLILHLKEYPRTPKEQEDLATLCKEAGYEMIFDAWKAQRPKGLVCSHEGLQNLLSALGTAAAQGHKILHGLYTIPKTSRWEHKKLPPENWVDKEQRDKETKIWNTLIKKYPLLTSLRFEYGSPIKGLEKYLKIKNPQNGPRC